MENERHLVDGRARVPDRYRVHLAPADVRVLGSRAVSLAADLADEALAFARNHGYALDRAPTVELVMDPSVAAGQIRVATDRVAADRVAPGAAAGARARPAAPGEPGLGPGSDDLTGTRAFAVQPVAVPAASLVELRPEGGGRRVVLGSGPLTIGRAADNDLVLDDRRVSRYHARLQARRGMLVLTDLDSANGSRVNSVAISEVALGAGDRIEIGTTILVVEAVPTG